MEWDWQAGHPLALLYGANTTSIRKYQETHLPGGRQCGMLIILDMASRSEDHTERVLRFQ